MRRLGQILPVLGVTGLVSIGGLAGCESGSPPTVGGVTYAYVEGDTEGYVPNAEQEVIEASKKVLTQTDIIVLETKTNEQGRTQISGETGNGTSVEVIVRPLDEATFLAVKVGLIGDDEASAALFARIRQELGLAVR
ncbi:MAG: DUF3568 family protein [Planctomycetota bacterium]